MNKFRKMICAALACLMLMQGAFAMGFDFFGGTEKIGIQPSDITDTGLIRVYLASLGDPEALLVTVAGEYAVEGSDALRFDRGAQLAIAADGSDIYMHVGGVTMNMGGEFTLTRCAAEEGAENGLYIYESEKNALYEGDLRIKNVDGRLMPILTISMEDYLCGVVAYEMSDSFPIEALKAQAVAARTYAMSKKVSRAANDYDVTDTTTDQVYKGFIGEYANVIQAVRETDGVVGTYNGGYAGCYYTASNGGQIATPNQIWGGDGDYAYIEQKEDPYDLENSRSLVNTFTAPVEYDGGNALWQLIMPHISVPGCVEFRADAITSVTLEEPLFEGSIMYSAVVFEVSVSARYMQMVECTFDGDPLTGWASGKVYLDGKWYEWGMSDWTPLENTQTVKLGVYDDIKDTLGLGLNSRDYEVLTVNVTDGVCTLEMRRYGHGVGMSQRGAQTMAGDYGFNYIEILNFYYPGMQLEKISWLENELPRLGELPRGIITERLLIPPAEGDLGELQEGEYFARVNLDNEKSRLNVRATPSTDAGVVAKLNDGYRLVVVSETEDGWAHVRAARFTGYVKLDYITAE